MGSSGAGGRGGRDSLGVSGDSLIQTSPIMVTRVASVRDGTARLWQREVWVPSLSPAGMGYLGVTLAPPEIPLIHFLGTGFEPVLRQL